MASNLATDAARLEEEVEARYKGVCAGISDLRSRIDRVRQQLAGSFRETSRFRPAVPLRDMAAQMALNPPKSTNCGKSAPRRRRERP